MIRLRPAGMALGGALGALSTMPTGVVSLTAFALVAVGVASVTIRRTQPR